MSNLLMLWCSVRLIGWYQTMPLLPCSLYIVVLCFKSPHPGTLFPFPFQPLRYTFTVGRVAVFGLEFRYSTRLQLETNEHSEKSALDDVIKFEMLDLSKGSIRIFYFIMILRYHKRFDKKVISCYLLSHCHEDDPVDVTFRHPSLIAYNVLMSLYFNEEKLWYIEEKWKSSKEVMKSSRHFITRLKLYNYQTVLVKPAMLLVSTVVECKCVCFVAWIQALILPKCLGAVYIQPFLAFVSREHFGVYACQTTSLGGCRLLYIRKTECCMFRCN